MTTADTSHPILASGTFRFADLEVHRLGYGTMQLTGDGVWGEPKDRDECIRVLRRAVELGVDFIDTAAAYGPYVSEELIREALHPYADELVIATKAGVARTGPGYDGSVPLGRPEYLREQCETSLRRLGVERIDLWQLHRIDPKVPAEEQFGVMKELLDEGKVRSLGLSEVSVAEIETARAIMPVATVENMYNLVNRQSEDVLEYCEKEQIGFIPWFPIASGELAKEGGPVDHIVKETGASPSQVALAWLLARSPVMLPIPGTKTVAHVEENCAAATVTLTSEQLESLTALK